MDKYNWETITTMSKICLGLQANVFCMFLIFALTATTGM